jgi:hypothetical protein
VHIPLFAEPAGDFQPVDAVYPGKPGRNLAGFVGLNGADKVPVDTLEIGQRGLLVERLLQVIFTEGGLPCGHRFAQFARRAGLADCQQAHGIGSSSRPQCCFLYASGYAPDVVCYAAHTVSLPLLE